MFHDIRLAIRGLRKVPAFTAAAVAILTLGSGATIAIYSVVDAVALRGLPYDNADRLVVVTAREPKTGRFHSSSAPQDFLDFRGIGEVFDSLAAYTSYGTEGFTLYSGGSPEQLRVQRVSASFSMLLVGLFGVLATVIVAAGVYGMLAWLVAQRTPEIGVRLALGARPGQVVQLILANVSVLLAAGLVIGLAGAWTLTRFVEALLYGVGPRDPWLFATAALVVFTSGMLAAVAPSMRASRVDPVVTLKSE